MEEHANWLTQQTNHLLGPIVLVLLQKLHIEPENAALPVPQHVVMGLFVLVVAAFLALIVKSRLSVEKPGTAQQMAELLLTNPLGFGVRDILRENVPHGFEKHIPVVGSISVFILLANLFGVFPFLSSPTGNATVPFCVCDRYISIFQLAGTSPPRRFWILKDVRRLASQTGRLGSCASALSRRTHQYDRPSPVSDSPALGEYFRQRHDLRALFEHIRYGILCRMG